MGRLARLVVAVAIAGVLAPLPGAQADGRDAGVRWKPCYPEAGPSFECATVSRAARLRPSQRAAASRSRSRACRRPIPGAGIGSIFLNPGGPGGSGVDFVVGAGPFLYTDEVRARFDLVGFDPRGIIAQHASAVLRQSRGVRSRTSPPFAVPDHARGGTRSGSRAGHATLNVARASAGRDRSSITCRRPTSPATSTLLRAAVGDRQLTYVGYSYGSYLGNDLREPVPRPCAGGRRRRRARPDRVDDGPRSYRGGGRCRSRRGCAATPAPMATLERVLPAVRRGRRPVLRFPAMRPRRFAALARAPAARAGRDHDPGRPAETFLFGYVAADRQ